MRSYTVGTGFSGIGTPDLAARLLGMTVCWQIEKDDFCQRVLRKNFPTVPNLYGDIYDAHPCYVDVEVFGFPCQPFSIAGKQLAEKDERFLIPEMLRVIDETRPRVVLLENVPRFASLNDGHSFKNLLEALAEMGFDAEWGHLSAADVGAPHTRERWWLVGYSISERVRIGAPSIRRSISDDESSDSSSERKRNEQQSGSEPRSTALGNAQSRRDRGNSRNVATQTRYPQEQNDGGEPKCDGQAGVLVGYPACAGQGKFYCGDETRQPFVADARTSVCNDLVNTCRARLQRRGVASGIQPQQPPADNAGVVSGSGGQGRTESRLGRIIDGDAGWLDGFRPYPARPGQEQHLFEPPRVTSRKDLRVQRLKALGNGMAFDAVYEWLRAIKLWLVDIDAQNAV